MENEKREEIELTFLMPCLNEANSVGECIDVAKKFIDDNKINGEIIISDNGSTDGSQEIIVSHGARLVETNIKGYGSALINGIKSSKGKYIIMGDSDMSYDFYNSLEILNKLQEGYDLVVGNRFKGGIDKKAMPFLHKYIGNPVLSGIGRLLYKTDIKDFHCGHRGFNRENINKLNLECLGMEFASEIIVKAISNNLKCCEVPVKLHKDKRGRKPHLKSFRDGYRHLKFLLYNKINDCRKLQVDRRKNG